VTSANSKLPVSLKTYYGIGQIAEGVKNTGFTTFLLFYYNSVLGLSGTYAGTALLIALVFDAVTDPLVGSLSDTFKHRLGRRHPFGLEPGIAPVAVSEEIVRSLGILYGPGTAIFGLLSVVLLTGYRLDRKRHAEVIEALAARRATKASSTSSIASESGV
jgi:Na+/melibiose symporter-like transporter